MFFCNWQEEQRGETIEKQSVGDPQLAKGNPFRYEDNDHKR